MSLKEKLLEIKKLNQESQFKIVEQQSSMSYQLGYEFDVDKDVNYDYLYEPFIQEYATLQLKLENGVSENPAYDRLRIKDITNSVDVIKNALENVLSNTEIWDTAVLKAGYMGGVDLMGTPPTRYKAINILADKMQGIINILAVDDDINKLAWDIYGTEGEFVERIYLNKLNKLSETQDMFITIPDVLKENNDFKSLSSEIFESVQIGDDSQNRTVTGGVTENYRKIKENGELEIITKPLKGGLEQDFYIIDKEAIGNSMQFNTEMNKITAGMISQTESSDPVIAFNNNILTEVTDHYLKPGKALRPNQNKRFQEDYKKWFLEKEIGNLFPLGEPRPTNTQLKEEEKVATDTDIEAQEQLEQAMV